MTFDDFLNECASDCVGGDGSPKPRKQSCSAPACCCDECWEQLHNGKPYPHFDTQDEQDA